MAESRFLYQMEFLKTGFAQRKKGADLLNRRDRSRVREIWSCHFSGQVLAALTDYSASGATVAEAAGNELKRQYEKSSSAREAARLLTQGFLMGLLGQNGGRAAGGAEGRERPAVLSPLSKAQIHIRETLAADGDFFSLAEGFSYLRMLYELQDLYEAEDTLELTALLHTCFQKLLQLLPSMAGVAKEQEAACLQCCLSLYQSTGQRAFESFRTALLETLERLLEQPKLQPGLEGAALGLLYGGDSRWEERILATAAGYLTGSAQQQRNSASFLRGLFYTARDIVFTQKGFVSMIDRMIGGLAAEDFLKLLPELRMAFGYFTPMETDRIAGQAAGLHGTGRERLLGGPAVSPLEYEYGESLNVYGTAHMEEVWT